MNNMTNDADVQMCLDDFVEVNQDKWKYATVEIVTQPFKAVRLHIGYNELGRKYIPHCTRHYTLDKNGNVYTHYSYHH
jgi:hypothetical protein